MAWSRRVPALFVILSALPLSSAVVGSIAGSVTDGHGVPQIGAAVTLLNVDGRPLQRVFTNERGAFVIDNLFPGFYGISVMVPSFLPALKERIRIEPGLRSFVAVQLANLFASFQLSYGDGTWRDRTEDWKWVLRTSSATRPVLRLTTPWEDKERASVLRKFHGVFGDVQGLVRLSAGDGGRVSPFGTESDIGTAFAVATSLFGNSDLLVSGNVGYGSTFGSPSAGFHTSYRREMPYGTQPEVSVTVRQMFRPLQAGQALFGPLSGTANDAVLQTFTLGYQDRVELGDMVKLEYGFLFDSIHFLDRLNYLSPFGRLTYRFNEGTRLALRYASGTPQAELDPSGEEALGRNLTALSMYPRLSLRNGRAALQRGEHMEIAVQQDLAVGGTVELAAYRDAFRNAALTALTPAGLYIGGDILPDLFTDTSSFNAGGYDTSGYRVSYKRELTEHVRAAFTYGVAGVLTPQRDALTSADPNELRSILRPVKEHSLSAQVSARLPQSRTWISSAYQWGSRTAVTAPDPFNINGIRALPGLNVAVRQPLPQPTYIPGKFEATAEFRNLLADGYVPIRTMDGRRLYLIQSARSFRGGVNFVF